MTRKRSATIAALPWNGIPNGLKMSSDVKALKGRHHGARHGRNFCRGSVCLLVIVALVLNFDARTGDWGTDRVIKETPDQMYEPTYPDYGNA